MADSSQTSPERDGPIMSAAPLFPVAAGFVLGVIAEAWWHPAPQHLLALVVLPLMFLRVRRIRGLMPVVLLCAGFGTGGYVHTARQVGAQTTVERFASESGLLARVRGVVASDPKLRRSDPGPLSIRAFRSERTTFLLDVEAIESDRGWSPIGGTVRVTIREALLDLNAGERVEVSGRLHLLRERRNPGAFDWAGHMRRQGVVGTFVAPHRENVSRRHADTPSGVAPWVSRVRRWLRGMLVDDLVTAGDQETGLLSAMVLGHRSSLDRKTNDVFVRSGCAHFLAVSGVHIVIVIMIAGGVCRLVGWTGRPRTVALMVSVVVYALIAEPRPSILRASVIAEIYFLSRFMTREGARLNWICATVLVLCVIDPDMIFDIGYQLSTGAVLGIFFLPDAIKQAARRAWDESGFGNASKPQRELIERLVATGRSPMQRARHASWNWTRSFLLEAWLVSVGAWLATGPIVLWYFGRLYPLGTFASLVMFPVVTILMCLGFLKLVLGLVAPPIAPLLTATIDSLDSFALYVADVLGSVPLATVAAPAPKWWMILTYYATIGLWVYAMWRARRATRTAAPAPPAPESAADGARTRSASRWHLILTLVAWVCAAGVFFVPSGAPRRLTITVLDVGAGSAIVLELPEGQTVLYDTGSLGPVDVGRDVVVPFLRRRGISRVDRVYVSHANLDHYNGIPSVAGVVPCGEVVTNHYFARDASPGSLVSRWRRLVADTGAVLTSLDPGDRSWNYGGVSFEWLWPPADDGLILDTNDTSTVLRLSYAGHSVLLTGDIEDAAQDGLLERDDLRADVLLAPHHGGVRPNSQAFYRGVGATTVIRSSRERMVDTVNGLSEIVGDAALFNTGDVGAVQVVIDARGVRTSGFRGTSFPLLGR